jgi:hypothetical protein
MPRKAQNIPANETKNQKFARLANQKVNQTLTLLKAVGGLGNRNQYESTPEQRKKIGEALTGAVGRAMDQMARGGETVQEFKL